MVLSVLGTIYTVDVKTEKEEPILSNCDGFCDKTSKRIVVRAKGDECELEDFDQYKRKVMRHEIIHAFLFESGIHENYKHDGFGHDEFIVDWFAVQHHKITRAFAEAGCLEEQHGTFEG